MPPIEPFVRWAGGKTWLQSLLQGDASMRKIIKNAVQCKLCGEIIESTDRHQYVTCKCGACAVDGGHDYLRRCFKDKGCYVDLSETIEISAEEEK